MINLANRFKIQIKEGECFYINKSPIDPMDNIYWMTFNYFNNMRGFPPSQELEHFHSYIITLWTSVEDLKRNHRIIVNELNEYL